MNMILPSGAVTEVVVRNGQEFLSIRQNDETRVKEVVLTAEDLDALSSIPAHERPRPRRESGGEEDDQ